MKYFRYRGFPVAMVDRFCDMGFDVRRVVEAFEHLGIERNGGQDYDIGDDLGEQVAERLFATEH